MSSLLVLPLVLLKIEHVHISPKSEHLPWKWPVLTLVITSSYLLLQFLFLSFSIFLHRWFALFPIYTSNMGIICRQKVGDAIKSYYLTCKVCANESFANYQKQSIHKTTFMISAKLSPRERFSLSRSYRVYLN